MAPHPRGSSRGTPRRLHPPTRDLLLRQGRLRQLRPPLKPNRTRTSAPPWRPPCCSSSPSRTPKPHSGAKTLPLPWTPPPSRLRPGLRTRRPNHLLKPQQDWGLLLQHSSPKTRTCVFPTAPPAETERHPSTCELAYHGIGSSSQTRDRDGIAPIL